MPDSPASTALLTEPLAPVFLTASWRSLLMINFAVDPDLLAPLVPRGTELEFWAGETAVSVVGFRFLDTRVCGVAIPFHRNFDEVNLRFYVRRRGPEGWRRGVVFVRELVPRRAIAWVARTIYGERYSACPMSHHGTSSDDGQLLSRTVGYSWRLGGRWHSIGATLAPDQSGEPAGAAGPLPRPELPAPGSAAELITEHYWGYAGKPGGPTLEYRVEHPPWPVWATESVDLELDAGLVYGERWRATLEGPPVSAFVAVGSPVVVRRGRPVA